ncbi:hypothetical protein F5I97DRAFT_1850396 [Phlebopus sp. FC_14]|nr:hypothetical protein F5I97DRAFT_1850396 [Phlebopus sp. FC_14]
MSPSVQDAVKALSKKSGAEEFDDRYPALESIRPWLEERGYYLYHHFYDVDQHGEEYPAFSYPHFQDTQPSSAPQLPYSFYGGGFTYKEQQHVVQSPAMDYMVFAQDSQRRHVAFKLTKESSVEYEAYRRLSKEECLYGPDPAEFGCVMPPLDFIDLGEGWWFVVMPRWGDRVFFPWFNSIREVLDFMRCCLKGICILHKHLIVYRDIKQSNILANQFAQGQYFQDKRFRSSLRESGSLIYALIDFDWSVVFPLDSKPSERRLHASESFLWYCSIAKDTSQGELDYDPFAFDVGSFGMFFCDEFQHLSTMVPMLAPLLDRMITRDIPTRFTATQALTFFDDYVLPSATPSALGGRPPERDRTILSEPESFDRWARLDPEFVKKWAAYRLPPLKRSTKILRWICGYHVGQFLVRSIRRAARAIGSTRTFILGATKRVTGKRAQLSPVLSCSQRLVAYGLLAQTCCFEDGDFRWRRQLHTNTFVASAQYPVLGRGWSSVGDMYICMS